MLDALRTYRLLRLLLALVVLGSVAVPLAAPVCAAAMHDAIAMEHEVMPGHEPMKRACCCGDVSSQDRADEAPCPDDVAADVQEAATPCCTVAPASPVDEAQDTAALASAPQVPVLTLSRLVTAPQPEVPKVSPHCTADDTTDPPELGAVARHVFIASFLI